MAYNCGWDSLPVRFKINFLEPCRVCASPRNDIPSIFLVFVWRPFLFVCFYHVTYEFESESTLYSCLNVKELLARSRRHI